MSHVTCHRCGSKEHHSGYGHGIGPFGSYTICEDCGALLEHRPDTDGLPDNEAEAAERASAELLAYHRMNGRERWLYRRRSARRCASRMRENRNACADVIAKHTHRKPWQVRREIRRGAAIPRAGMRGSDA